MKQAISVVLAVFLVVLFLNLHIVHRKDGFVFLWKDHLTLKDTFVDIRGMNQQDLMSLPLAVRELAMQEQYGQMSPMTGGTPMTGMGPRPGYPNGMNPMGMPPRSGGTMPSGR